MVTKVLAAVFAVAVLTVGGYTYWQYSDGCCGTPPASDQPPSQPISTSLEVPPCCLEPSRTSRFSLSKPDGCCEDVDFNARPRVEVLTVQPREVQ
jgi:hypothetical protein